MSRRRRAVVFLGLLAYMLIGFILSSCFFFDIDVKVFMFFSATSTVIPAIVHHGMME